MRNVIAAIAGVLGALVVANMLGVASAEAPTGTPVRTVSVGGVAKVAIAQGADAAAATAVYRQGMAAAVSDGQSKAAFLASKAGVTLGSLQSMVEGGGYIGCTGSGETEYAEYQGEQPDFASPAESGGGPVRLVAGAKAPANAPSVRRPSAKRHKRTAPSAKKAGAPGCTLTAEVTLVYGIA
jgi:hypothetical protein